MLNRPETLRKDSSVREEEGVKEPTRLSPECSHSTSANGRAGKALTQFLIKRQAKVGA